MKKIKFGFFDLGMMIDGTATHLKTIENSIKTAQLVEKKGFSRYWLGEHHNRMYAWRSADSLIVIIAGVTSNIRVGAAGVLISIHNPLLIAQQYKLINALFGDRIDLGFSKGSIGYGNPGKEILMDGRSELGLVHNQRIKLTQEILLGLRQGILIPPVVNELPQMWVLGTGASAIEFAAANNLNCCISFCHGIRSSEEQDQIVNAIKAARKRSTIRIGILIGMVCAEKKSTAVNIALKKTFPEYSVNYSGDPSECLLYVKGIRKKFDPDELIFANIFHNHQDKLNTIKNLATILIKRNE